MIDLQLFLDILGFDSTSGKERQLSDFLEHRFSAPKVDSWELEDGTRNLLFSWGRPTVVFCTHLDTVPPYIAPHINNELDSEAVHGQNSEAGQAEPEGQPLSKYSAGRRVAAGRPEEEQQPDADITVFGRGSCDAKGQIISMYTACKRLEAEGLEGFALLLVSGEETGSWGAKAFARVPFQAPFLIIGEPTENKMVSASKGTKAFALNFKGEAFHSGYPQFGASAVERFVDFANTLRAVQFPSDPELGPTTYNIGKLLSDNPQNVLSPELRCRVYFRTTFASDEMVQRFMADYAARHEYLTMEAIGGDAPARYFTIPGFESAPVAFGSDAPHLTNFEHRAICGPGSIRHAHRDDEQILLSDMEKAVEQYVAMFKTLE